MRFEVDQTLQAMLFGETFDNALPMLVNTRTRSDVTPTYRVPFGLLVMM